MPKGRGSGRTKTPKVSRFLGGGLRTVRMDSGVATLAHRGREGVLWGWLILRSRLCFRLIFDEVADGLGPAPVVGVIVANRSGPEMSGECACTGDSRHLMRDHSCSLRQGIPKDYLDVVG